MVMTHDKEVLAVLNGPGFGTTSKSIGDIYKGASQHAVSEEGNIEDIPFGDVMEYAYCLGITLDEVTYKGYSKWAKAIEDGTWWDMVTRWALSGPNGGITNAGYRTRGTQPSPSAPSAQEKIEALEEKVQTLQGELWEVKNASAALAQTKYVIVLAKAKASPRKIEKLHNALAEGVHTVKIDGVKFKLNGKVSIEGIVKW